jgi:hypothetical protein
MRELRVPSGQRTKTAPWLCAAGASSVRRWDDVSRSAAHTSAEQLHASVQIPQQHELENVGGKFQKRKCFPCKMSFKVNKEELQNKDTQWYLSEAVSGLLLCSPYRVFAAIGNLRNQELGSDEGGQPVCILQTNPKPATTLTVSSLLFDFSRAATPAPLVWPPRRLSLSRLLSMSSAVIKNYSPSSEGFLLSRSVFPLS